MTKAVVFPMTPRRPVTAAHTHMIVNSRRGGDVVSFRLVVREMFSNGEEVIFIARNIFLS